MAQLPASRRSRDPIEQALHQLRATGTFYCRSELTAPWGLTMPPMPGCIWFHAVTTGAFNLGSSSGPDVPVRAGDFVLVPHGRGHQIRTHKRVRAPDVLTLPHESESDHYAELYYGDGGETTTTLCGVIRLEHPLAFDLDSALPDLIHLRADDLLDAAWMQSTLRLIAAESKTTRPGGETIITRLCDVLVIQAIRAWLAEDDSAGGWLGALHDEQVGRALVGVHRHPEQAWSVVALAREAGMSRSGFANRFHELVGEPPMQYVTRLRMRLARVRLAERRCSVGEAAEQLGYRSEAAFCRAFKRFVGVTPGAVRRGSARADDRSRSAR